MDTSICGFEVFPERLSGVEDGPGDIDASAREGDEGCRHAVLALHSDQSQSLISVRVRRRDRAVLPPEPSRAASMTAIPGPCHRQGSHQTDDPQRQAPKRTSKVGVPPRSHVRPILP